MTAEGIAVDPCCPDRAESIMKAMVLDACVNLADNSEPLRLVEVPIPVVGHDDLLIQVLTCGVCHTELDEIEGRTHRWLFPRFWGIR